MVFGLGFLTSHNLYLGIYLGRKKGRKEHKYWNTTIDLSTTIQTQEISKYRGLSHSPKFKRSKGLCIPYIFIFISILKRASCVLVDNSSNMFLYWVQIFASASWDVIEELNLIKKQPRRIGDWTSGEMLDNVIIDSGNFLKFFQTFCNQANWL